MLLVILFLLVAVKKSEFANRIEPSDIQLVRWLGYAAFPIAHIVDPEFNIWCGKLVILVEILAKIWIACRSLNLDNGLLEGVIFDIDKLSIGPQEQVVYIHNAVDGALLRFLPVRVR